MYDSSIIHKNCGKKPPPPVAMSNLICQNKGMAANHFLFTPQQGHHCVGGREIFFS